MNLFLRFMIVLLSALRSPIANDPLAPTRVTVPVWRLDQAFAPAVPLHRIRSFTDLATINSVIRIGLSAGRIIMFATPTILTWRERPSLSAACWRGSLVEKGSRSVLMGSRESWERQRKAPGWTRALWR